MAAELGIQRNSEQIDALETMGINPLGYLVGPRLLAALLVFPIHTAFFDLIGIFGGSWLTARLTRAELAADLRWSEIASLSLLAGVGFTVALLIGDLAFEGDPAAQEVAKTAVLVGSVIAAALAAFSLRRRTRARLRD